MMQFNRKVELVIGNKSFTFPEFTIYFRVEYSDKDELNDAEISIYNLSNQTLNNIKKGDNVILNAGYEGDVGNIFIGIIDDVNTKQVRTDKITKILALDTSEQWIKSKVNKTYKAGIKASQILRDIVGLSSLIPGPLVLPNDVVYKRGRTINSKLPATARQICTDCGAKVQVTKRKIYIRDPKQGDNINFLFNSSRGLIGTPERFEDDDATGYNVTALLNHRVQTDSIVGVQSSTANGNFRVRKAVFRADRRDFYLEMEVVG